MLDEDNKPRTKSGSYQKTSEKASNDLFSSFKQREKAVSVQRSSSPDIAESYSHTLQNEKSQGLYPISETITEVKTKNGGKTMKFRNFLTALEEHQKKVSIDNMNLLGLEVKKVNYSEKTKRISEKQLVPFNDDGSTCLNTKEDFHPRSCVKKASTFDRMPDFQAIKLGITFRQANQLVRTTKMPRSSFVKTRQKALVSSHSEKKRKIVQCQNPVYDNRINSYKDLIFKLNVIHGVYVETEKDILNADFVFRNEMKYKAWIGSGNNGNLIKGLIKRRFWWHIIDEKSTKAHFIWTQLKNSDYFANQTPCTTWVQSTNKFLIKVPVRQQQVKPLSKLIRHKNLSKREVGEEDHLHKIYTQSEILKFRQYSKRIQNKSYKEKKQFLELVEIDSYECKMHNHLINNFYLGNKKALFYNLKQYYTLIGENVFSKIPLTFHIKKGFQDIQYKRFLAYYKKRQAVMKKQQKENKNDDQDSSYIDKRKMRNVWIVKPGEITNRGHGITVIDEVSELNQIMRKQSQHQNGVQKTFIVQLYIDRPFLYHKRKFDIRHFLLITHVHGLMRAYWYKEGYIRTSSYEFDIEDFQRQIHLTNDAVQKYTPLYGKYEPGNKVSYSEFQRYLDNNFPKKNYKFESQILPQMKSICLDAVKSSCLKLSPQRLKHNFEIFGLDFMIDENFKPWLIEINTNPCLQISCSLLGRIIPQMVDQALRLSLDIVFPPPCHYPNTWKHLAPEAGLQNLNYELIFDEKRDGGIIRSLYKKQSTDLLQEIGDVSDDEVYQDDGKDVQVDTIL